MWVVVLRERGEFEGLREHFESLRAERYKRLTTGTGAEVLESPLDSGWPHLALASEDTRRVRAMAQWINRNLTFRGLVSSGLVTPCGPGDHENSPYFIPYQCLRSAGRMDVGGSPILYEEIPFSDEVQRELAQTLLLRPLEQRSQLFAIDRVITDAETKLWVRKTLDCEAFDDFTAELLLMGKRFGTRVGCLKVFENAKDPVLRLQEAWQKLSS
ncbi:MAG: hypothetical protein JST16_07075 [Bdellovibrionales bacterium]|nr:hypothetical protein [Bdellovibrionales bacterium]